MMGKPLLERSMLKFKDCGITEIILSTCYKSQMIEEYYADILSDISIRDMIKFHKVKRAAVTIAVTQVENYSAYGVIEYNDNLYVKTLLLALIVLLVLILLLAVIVG